MPSTRAVWGIDLGHCALKALRVRAVGERIEVLSHEYIEHAKAVSQPDAESSSHIADALRELFARHSFRQDRVVVSVPGQGTLCRFSKLPPVDPKRLPDMVRYEASQQIPFDMDEVVWDYQTFRPESTGPSELEVGIFAIRRDLLHKHMKPFLDAGLSPVAVQSSPLALYNAWYFDGFAPKEPSLLLDMGVHTTDLIVADAGGLWTRTIPIGGNAFTEALAKTFKLSSAKAESLKREAAKSKYARQIFQAMRPVFAELVSEIQRSLGFYGSTRRGVKFARVIAMGEAFRLPGLTKFLQSNLGYEVMRPTKFSRMSLAGDSEAARLMEHLPAFGVSYGLAIQGLGLSRVTSSLLPPEIAKAIAWRRKVPVFWSAAACLALSAAMVLGRGCSDGRTLASVKGNYAGNVSSMSEDEAMRVLRQGPDENRPPGEYAAQVVGMANAFRQRFGALESEANATETKMKQLADLQEYKTLWPRILQAIHNCLPRPPKNIADAMAKGPQAYISAIKAIPREQREQVFIRSMSVRYSANVGALFQQLIAEDKGAGSAGQPAMAFGGASTESPDAASSEAGGPGYVIRIIGQTPNRGASAFVNDRIIKRLREIKVAPSESSGFGFHFAVQDQNCLRWCTELSKYLSTSSGGSTGSPLSPYGGSYGGGRFGPGVGTGFLGREGGSATPTPGGTTTKLIDPVTDEPMENDQVFQVMFQVVLDAPAPAGTTPGMSPNS